MSDYEVGATHLSNKGNEYTILGQKGRYFILSCSVCSLDEELWPKGSVKTTKQGLDNALACCACSGKYRWTEVQNKIRVERVCKERSISFYGFKGSHIGNKTLLKLRNTKTGSYWETTPLYNFIHKPIQDPTIRYGYDRKAKESTYIENFRSLEVFPEGTLFKRREGAYPKGTATFWDVFCPLCDADEYSRNGLGSGWFISRHQHLSDRWLPCRCSKVHVLTEEQTFYKFTKALQNRGTLKAVIKSGKGLRYVKWQCHVCHQNNTTLASNLLRRNSCNGCSNKGFQDHKKGTLYIVKWSDGNFSCIKYGITNRTVGKRIQEQELESKLLPTVLKTYSHENGAIIRQAEKSIRASLGGSYCPKELLPQGYTETLPYSEKVLASITGLLAGFPEKLQP